VRRAIFGIEHHKIHPPHFSRLTKHRPYEKGKTEYEHRLEASREVGDRQGEATSLNNLGSVAESIDEYEDAREYCESELDLFQRLGTIRKELLVRRNLIELDTENPATARSRCDDAFDRLDEIDRDLPDEREKYTEFCEDIPDSVE
jgi:hypothetical protein